ncbi:SurA N-terminal domain-containing protein [Desulfurobacterium sp.]
MLANIRKNMKLFSIPLWIVTASFVLTIFLVWGKGSVSGPGTNEVATVNGKAIPADEFYRTVDRLTSSGMKEKQAKSEALRQLLLRTLLLDAAEKEGLKVSDEAVARKIESFPAFQKDGRFSADLYQKWLQQNHLPAEVFENQIRKDLLIEKLQTIVENVPSVTQEELNLYYRAVFGRRNYRYRIFKINTANVKVSSKEIMEYYKKHPELFTENRTVVTIVRIPKNQKEAKDLVKEAYKLARAGKLSSFKKVKPESLLSGKLFEEISRKKDSAGYLETGSEYIIYERKKENNTIPFNSVKTKIASLLKMEKAARTAFKNARKEVEAGKITEGKETGQVDGKELARKLKLIDLNGEITAILVKGKTNKVYGPFKTINGYVIVEPLTETSVKQVDRDKMKTLKEFLLDEKKKAAFQAYVQFLQNKAKIQVNPKFFKGD